MEKKEVGKWKMKYFSMFSGVGGFELGIGDKGESVGYSEVDKYSIQTYEKHFPNHKNYGDATTIVPEEIPDFELLCGGFPCQAFSVAGKRKGFEDTRGTLFHDIVRILKIKRPKYLLLENVKGLLNHDRGRTFATILASLSELGYFIQWMVLNSKFFGVPQNRERVFIIGSLRGEPRPEILPFRKSTDYVGERNQQNATTSNTITSRYWKGGAGTHIERVIQRIPLRFLQRNQKNIEGDYSFTVDSSNTGGVRRGTRIGKLTPLECERLQGFPDNWTEGVSDTQRYKQMGNAVTVNVVQAIMEKLVLKW